MIKQMTIVVIGKGLKLLDELQTADQTPHSVDWIYTVCSGPNI